MANKVSCDDGNLCTVSDLCVDNKCGGSAFKCDDGNPCTADTCNEKIGCVFMSLNGTSCEDDNACIVSDMCVIGMRAGDVCVVDCARVIVFTRGVV